jgi:hypothetical protein
LDKGQGVVVNRLEQYKKGIVEIERPFIGLSYAQALLAKSLITRADPATGIVNDISYQDLANLLTINPAPGRKNSGTPTKQTIRNYIKSIERECGKYFKVISEGQNLQFLFPELPKIFSKIFEDREVNTQVNSSNAHKNTEENKVFDDVVNIHLNTDVNPPNSAVKKLFININNKHNKQTHEKIGDKKLITENFYPSAATIEQAHRLGFTKVTDPDEIKDFIKYNLERKTLWVDHNPLFLKWLERDFSPNGSINLVKNNKNGTGINHNEHSSHQSSTAYQPTLEDLRKRNEQIIRESTLREQEAEQTSSNIIEGEYCESMVNACRAV